MIHPLHQEWRLLTYANPKGLSASSEQLHHAAQYIALLGEHLFPSAEDDSHTSMSWLPEQGALAGLTLPLNLPLRLALVFEAFELRFLDRQHLPVAALKLDGQRKVDVLNWLRETITYFGGPGFSLAPIRRFAPPLHALDHGASFHKTSIDSLQELARYRHNATLILSEITSQVENAGPVRTWPHHFDTAGFLPTAFGPDGKAVEGIGIGLAIPDQYVQEPYFYAAPWRASGEPYFGELSELPHQGRWFRNGWTGATLAVSELLNAADALEQKERVQHFFQAGIRESAKLLQGQEAGT